MTSVSASIRLDRNSELLLAFILAVATLTLFSRSIAGEFVNWDDGVYITENPQVQAGLSSQSVRWAWAATTTGNWHPLTWMALQLDWQLFECRPWGFHVTNVVLHTANA